MGCDQIGQGLFAQQGLTVNLVIDRSTASRFGITPATVDNALYDLFGQRIISTIYTQSNQYRVIMEADPALQNSLSAPWRLKVSPMFLVSRVPKLTPYLTLWWIRGSRPWSAGMSRMRHSSQAASAA